MPPKVLNHDTDHRGYLDLNKKELRQPVAQNAGSDPGSPVEGQFFWRSDTHKWRVYDGTSWTDLGATSGGILATLVNAKGDLIVATADDTVARKGVGADGTFLVADSGQSDGLNYRVISTSDITELLATSNLTDWPRVAALDLNNQKITSMSDGVATTDGATFGQLNAILQGRKWKDPVRAVATTNIVLTGTQTIDGTAVIAGDRVLAAGQTTSADKGIYVVAAGAWARATDADSATKINQATVYITTGTSGIGDEYTQTATVATLGTDGQTWTKTGEGNTAYSADGTTLTLTGTTFSVTATKVVQATTGSLTGGSVSEVLTHNLNTRKVKVTIRNNASPYDEIDVHNEATSVNTVTVFAAAGTTLPASYTWMVEGVQ